MTELILHSTLLLAILGAYEWRLRSLSNKISNIPSRDEVIELIDLKLEVIKYINDDLKNSMIRLEKKIDSIYKKILGEPSE